MELTKLAYHVRIRLLVGHMGCIGPGKADVMMIGPGVPLVNPPQSEMANASAQAIPDRR